MCSNLLITKMNNSIGATPTSIEYTVPEDTFEDMIKEILKNDIGVENVNVNVYANFEGDLTIYVGDAIIEKIMAKKGKTFEKIHKIHHSHYMVDYVTEKLFGKLATKITYDYRYAGQKKVEDRYVTTHAVIVKLSCSKMNDNEFFEYPDEDTMEKVRDIGRQISELENEALKLTGNLKKKQ